MKTIVYVDGYNFYYGCLKGTPHKWLDIVHLFQKHILPSSSFGVSSELVKLNYFTADILERAARSPDSVSSQMKYLRALGLTYPTRVQIHKGFYTLLPMKAHVMDSGDEKKRLRDSPEVLVWKMEEKQSDVRLALEVFQDAMTGVADQIVICSNDTDIAPALEKLRAHRPHIKIGLVVPTRDAVRRPNKDMAHLADWVRTHIRNEELADSQYPNFIPAKRKGVTKPASW
ncbi:MAG: NYN domain-containing protein [Moraxellaceae bacterium]|nr:NYN domain-containing protein [Moraxellaceae bacterium]